MTDLPSALAVSMLAMAFHPAEAAVVVFDSRADYIAAQGPAVRENWDGFANQTVIPDGSSVNGITYDSSTGNALVTASFLSSTIPNGLGRTGLGFFDAGESITFTFASPILAFGIDVNTGSALEGDFTATTDAGDTVPSAVDPFPGFGTGQFIGFASDTPFTRVTIAAVGEFSFTLDTLRAVDAPSHGVPAPGSLALAVAALMGLGAAGRSRRVHPAAH